MRLSDTTGAISSPNSSRDSRPILNSAPVIGARTLSPEQSAKIFAVTVWNFCVVVCQPVTDLTRFPSISQARQEQLSIRSMFGSFLISSYVTLSQIEKLSVGLRLRFISASSSTMPLSWLFLPCAPRIHILISPEAFPPTTGRSFISTTLAPCLVAATAANIPAAPAPTIQRSAS